jgi:hypothetical protein
MMAQNRLLFSNKFTVESKIFMVSPRSLDESNRFTTDRVIFTVTGPVVLVEPVA